MGFVHDSERKAKIQGIDGFIRDFDTYSRGPYKIGNKVYCSVIISEHKEKKLGTIIGYDGIDDRYDYRIANNPLEHCYYVRVGEIGSEIGIVRSFELDLSPF